MRKFSIIIVLIAALFVPCFSFNLPQAKERKITFVSDFLNNDELSQSAAVGLSEMCFVKTERKISQADFIKSGEILPKKNPSNRFSSGFT